MAAPTYKDLMAMIGNLLVAWGQAESALNKALVGLQLAQTDLTKSTFAKRVDLWHAELLGFSENSRVKTEAAEMSDRIGEIRRLRNLICHHLHTASAATEECPEPFIVALENETSLVIPYSTVERAYDDLVRYRSDFKRLIDTAREYPR